ncbi:hypothetical protein [Lysobacter enzymogenes]|uniref:hypothetical protein n=1 Tax=Lysobacter enzymogenes TaxID=69 RepID=UPI000F4C78E6|nr:hypothetical protein [Lysobacter enzymogenes]
MSRRFGVDALRRRWGSGYELTEFVASRKFPANQSRLRCTHRDAGGATAASPIRPCMSALVHPVIPANAGIQGLIAAMPQFAHAGATGTGGLLARKALDSRVRGNDEWKPRGAKRTGRRRHVRAANHPQQPLLVPPPQTRRARRAGPFAYRLCRSAAISGSSCR